jgi:hypothetical protein
MFRVLGFWALVIGLMALAGDLIPMAVIFFFQTILFVVLGYMKLTERTYMLMFWAYMVISFSGFTYWSFFKMSV